MYELNDQMFNAVFALSEDYRRFFCLNKCEEHGVICFLKEKGDSGSPLMIEDEAENDEEEGTMHTMLPVWCHPRYVEYYLEHSFKGERDDYEIVEMRLDLFKEQWVPVLKQNSIAIAFMPLEQDKMFCVDEADFLLKSPEERQAAAEAEAKEISETVKKEMRS